MKIKENFVFYMRNVSPEPPASNNSDLYFHVGVLLCCFGLHEFRLSVILVSFEFLKIYVI